MKAVVYNRYGSPDALELKELEKPVPGDHEVRVQVHAVSINSWDWDLLRGVPFVNRMMAGVRKPKRITILGCDIAGQVEAIGKSLQDEPARMRLITHENGVQVDDSVKRQFPNHAEHDPSDIHGARELAEDETALPLGILYRNPEAPR
mgnify:CR=1 FL=1